VKQGSVLVFVLVVSAAFSWLTLGNGELEARFEKLAILTLTTFCAVFSFFWYRMKSLANKVEKLEGLLNSRQSPESGLASDTR
jgi:hypothetical protein